MAVKKSQKSRVSEVAVTNHTECNSLIKHENILSPYLSLSYLDIVQVLVPHVLAAGVGRHVGDLTPLPVVVALAPELHIPALLDLKHRDCCDAMENQIKSSHFNCHRGNKRNLYGNM